jgi:tocopherol O-methyltransferase
LDVDAVREHYDRLSYFYRLLWGDHIHHGYWEDGESAEVAQVRLIERLARAASLRRGAEVLDAGCGLGGSSLWLARTRGCRVTGVTLSPVQARMARAAVLGAGLADLVTILRADLETFARRPASLDVVWSIECTEHLRDKAGFIARAADWLRPEGRIALCTWTRDDRLGARDSDRYLKPICRGFLCPSLGSAAEYSRWMEQCGLVVEERADLTERTAHTWEVCLQRTRKLWVRLGAMLLGRDTGRFLSAFPLMLEAYRSGALRYSLIVGRKPAVSGAACGRDSSSVGVPCDGQTSRAVATT